MTAGFSPKKLTEQAQEFETSVRFRQIADALQEALALINADFTEILYLNPAYEKIWGRTRESVYAAPMSWLDGVHPEDRQQVTDALQRLLRGEQIDNLEYRVVRPDGGTSWVASRGYPVLDSNGHLHRLVCSAQDITRSKEAELALKRGEAYLAMGQRIAGIGTWVWDASSGEMLGSQEFFRIFGIDPRSTKLTREALFQRVHPEDRSRYEQRVRAAAGQKSAWEIEYRIVLPDDSIKHIRCIGRPVINQFGVISELVATEMDLTERRLAEDALRESEERFRQMAENIEEIFWLLDPKTLGAVYVSPAFEQICERPLASIYSDPTSYREIIHPDDANRVLERLADLEKTGEFFEQFRIVCPRGAVKWVEVRGFTAKDPNGNVKALVGKAQDITERRRAEEALRESEDRYRDLVEHSQDLICTHTLGGILLSVNEAPLRILGYSREELLNKPLRDFVTPETKPLCDAYLAQVQRDGFAKGLLPVLTKSGEVRLWEYNNSVRLEGVSQPIVRGIAHDVTEQKLAEKALRHLSRRLLQLQDEERRKIARDLHDTTGQDLVAISATLGQLHALIPSSSRKSRKLIAQCQALADRCIRDVRTLSYVLHPPMLEEAGLEDAIRHYVEGFAERTGIEVTLELSPSFGRLTREMELGLFRVVQESLINIQRHSGGGTARILLDRDSEKIMLEVRDQGRGISANKRRGNNGILPVAGVGIPSMDERVKQIGGRLDIESSNRGTTVRVTIPVHD